MQRRGRRRTTSLGRRTKERMNEGKLGAAAAARLVSRELVQAPERVGPGPAK